MQNQQRYEIQIREIPQGERQRKLIKNVLVEISDSETQSAESQNLQEQLAGKKLASPNDSNANSDTIEQTIENEMSMQMSLNGAQGEGAVQHGFNQQQPNIEIEMMDLLRDDPQVMHQDQGQVLNEDELKDEVEDDQEHLGQAMFNEQNGLPNSGSYHVQEQEIREELAENGVPRKRDEKASAKKTMTKVIEEDYMSSRNIEITIRDSENMNEYSAKVVFEPRYLPKLLQWAEKRRFTVSEHANEDSITLKVDIFTFDLKSKNTSKEEVSKSLLGELQKVKTERQNIIRDIKLFNYFIFNVYNETEFKGRNSSNYTSRLPINQLERIIEQPEALFIVKEAYAVKQPNRDLLCFSEDMCFDETPQRFPGPYADKFLIDGPGFSFQSCPLSKRDAI